jgi:hypothetical protein
MLGHLVSNQSAPATSPFVPKWLKRLIALLRHKH